LTKVAPGARVLVPALALGLCDVRRAASTGRPVQPAPGFVVAANARDDSFDPAQLWVRSGRLYRGANPLSLRAFDQRDMMVLEIHRGSSRAESFATLPPLAARVAELDAIRRNAAVDDVAKQVNASLRGFEAAQGEPRAPRPGQGRGPRDRGG
jgi:hypothetical protein